MPTYRNNSAHRLGGDDITYGDNFERIFGTEAERKLRAPCCAEIHKHKAARSKSAYIMKPIEEFKSMVDGAIISDHKQLKDHNKRNGVTNSADYNADFMQRRRATIGATQDRENKAGRIDALKHVMRIKGYE